MEKRNRNLIIGMGAGALAICCCVTVCLAATLMVSCQLPTTSWFTPTATARSLRQPTATPRAAPREVDTPTPRTVLVPTAAMPTEEPDRTPAPADPTIPPQATSPRDAATPGATPAATATSEDIGPELEATATPEPALSTEERLALAVLPTRDMRDLALRLRPNVDQIPEVVNTVPPEFAEGDVEPFWVGNVDTEEHFQIEAVLRVKLPHVYMWVEQGVEVDQDDLERSARRFEEQTYPIGREFFGSEWSPGVDNDVHLTILNASNLGDHVAGYFSSADEFSRLANPFSNEKEMFYINLDNNPPGTFFYDGTLAHEFQHMIHWANDRNEDTWVNEGMSELATELNGFDRGGADLVFAQQPDTQLTTWTDVPELNTAHYGSAYLFMSYFLDRFGEELTQAVVASPADGPAGFDEAFAQAGLDLTFDDVFGDWLIANYLDNTTLADGRYGYQRDNPRQVDVEESYRNYPIDGGATVSQYGADYYQLVGRGDVTITFCGETETHLAATEAHGGAHAWWSHRADDSDMRLTRGFDLSGLSKATLEFWTWYHIEEGYDYGYVVVSTDGGRKWTVLEGQHTRDYDPVGNAFGIGYTGKSTDPGTPEWVQERVDLSPFAGQEILLRFEYVTDDAVTYPGWFVDDIAVPELGYFDDGERGQGGWVSEGWVLSDGVLPQHWLVQVIEQGFISAEVRQMVVDEDGCGSLDVEDVGSRGRRAVIVISAQAPVTTETAAYAFQVEER